MSLYQCPVCKDIVTDNEPCWCVFTGPSTLDAKDMLHTAIRIPVDRNVLELEMSAHDAHNQLAWAALREMYYGEVDPHAVAFGG